MALDEEILDTGARRRLPRWVVVLGLVVIAVGAASVVALNGDDAAPRTRPSDSSAVPPPSRATAVGVDAVATLPDRGSIFTISGSVVREIGANGIADRFTGGLDVPSEPGHVKLLADTRDTVWVVPLVTGFPDRLAGVRVGALEPFFDYPLPGIVSAAAALDDEIYLVTRDRLYVADEDHRSIRYVARLPGFAGSLVADPRRARLLYLSFDRASMHVRSLGVSGTAGGERSSAPVPIGKGDLAVIDGTIWVSGFSNDGPVLVRLDPATLAPGRNLADGRSYGGGVSVAGIGDFSLYVRGSSAHTALRCLDGATGALRKLWPSQQGLVVSTRGRGYIAEPFRALARLDLGGCRG